VVAAEVTMAGMTEALVATPAAVVAVVVTAAVVATVAAMAMMVEVVMGRAVVAGMSRGNRQEPLLGGQMMRA